MAALSLKSDMISEPGTRSGFVEANVDRYAEATKICRMLTQAGYPTMLAGGCVRDRLFGLDPADFDLATQAEPEEVLAFFHDLEYQTVPVGIEHGTVLVVGETQSLEITTLRHDVACDGRRAEVAFSQDFSEDAQRRDFTINALFEDVDGNIHDFVGGLEDLKARRLRFVGDPHVRIEEDYLRILRYFRFLARLGWAPDTVALAAIAASVSGLERLSMERVFHELQRTLIAPHYHQVLPFMVESGMLNALFPWFRAETLPDLVHIAQNLKVQQTTLPWFALIIKGSGSRLRGKALQTELQRLRFSKNMKKALGSLAVFFENLDQAEVALTRLLALADHHCLDLRELNHFCECCSGVAGWNPAFPIMRMLKGMITMEPPQPPRDTLMGIPARERRTALDLVKIYWYLGLCRAKTQMTDLMKARRNHASLLTMRHLSMTLARTTG